LEQHWNGALLTDVQTMLAWAQSMNWKGIHPLLNSMGRIMTIGISLTQKAMQAIEERLQRHPLLPKWGILIRPK
jgi:hypothetical protein